MLAAANLQEACVKTSQLRAEYHKRAAEARRLAEDAADPEVKVDLFAVEQRWLALADADQEELVR
jgi:hypothetical protein